MPKTLIKSDPIFIATNLTREISKELYNKCKFNLDIPRRNFEKEEIVPIKVSYYSPSKKNQFSCEHSPTKELHRLYFTLHKNAIQPNEFFEGKLTNE